MPKLFFPKKTIAKMKRLGIREADIRDVFQTGIYTKHDDMGHMMTKHYSYSGYEIGFIYKQDPKANRYIITTSWKTSY